MADDEGTQGGDGLPVKPEQGSQPAVQHLTLTIRKQDLDPMSFKVKATTKFGRIFSVFCERTSLERHVLRFLTGDGLLLRDTQTPEEVKIEDGDSIDCVMEQIGGGR